MCEIRFAAFGATVELRAHYYADVQIAGKNGKVAGDFFQLPVTILRLCAVGDVEILNKVNDRNANRPPAVLRANRGNHRPNFCGAPAVDYKAVLQVSFDFVSRFGK